MPPAPPRVPEITTLRVRLGRRAVGMLTLLPGDRTLFAFDDEYLDDPERPMLSLSFKDRFGGIVAEQAPTRVRVPPFFSNLLPEGHLREYLAARAGVKDVREFFLLQVLGKDLPGAVVVESDAEEARPPSSPRDDHDEHRPPHDDARNALRFSLAGVQLKFSAVMEADGGLTIPAQGAGGSWIVKLPSARFEGVAENEFSMMRLAARLGLDVPEVRLVDLDAVTGLPQGIGTVQGKALAVRRFDRAPDGVRVHRAGRSTSAPTARRPGSRADGGSGGVRRPARGKVPSFSRGAASASAALAADRTRSPRARRPPPASPRPRRTRPGWAARRARSAPTPPRG